VLSEVEAALVRYAIEELGGAFKVDPLYGAMKSDMSRRQIVKLGRDWEQRGWLTKPQRDDNGHPIGRQVTPELEELAGLTPAHKSPTPSGKSGNTDKAVQRAVESDRERQKAGKKAVRGPTEPTESEDGLSAALSPSDHGFCPILECRWNTDGRGACDYAQRGLRCGDPQWRDEWQEKMEGINGND
jgi:hypothetical protein